MSQAWALRAAGPGDLPGVRALVAAAGLPTGDLAPGRQEFVVAVRGERLVGCAGLEPYGEAALLRSYAVEPGSRRAGLGSALHGALLARAAARGVRDLYLLTTTAEGFFLRHGFERVERDAVPPDLAACPELRSLCPASAACLHRRLG